MIGGPMKSFERAKFVLQAMGTHLIHCGDKPGSGQVAKICNNLLLGISMAGLCEVMKIAEKSGINLELMTKIINASSGRCWSSDTYNPVPGIMPNVPASNNYQGGFGVTLMKKDLTYGIQEARHLNLELPTAKAALEIYSKLASSNAFKDKDFSSYYKAIDIEQ